MNKKRRTQNRDLKTIICSGFFVLATQRQDVLPESVKVFPAWGTNFQS
jgi:hypothetical protein